MKRVMTRKPRTRVSKKEAAEKWSGQYGLKNLYVAGASEAEPHIVADVVASCVGSVCEVGCGDGRIAAHFATDRYIGVDISPLAVAKAKQRCPGHTFKRIEYDEDYPQADTFVFYTVLLHVPDDVIGDMFARAKKAGAKRIIIYEVMLGWVRDYARHDNFHRNPDEFIEASGFNETSMAIVRSKFFPWHGNILVLGVP